MLVEKKSHEYQAEVLFENNKGRFALYVGDRCVAACKDELSMQAARRLLGITGYQSIREKDHDAYWVQTHMDPQERARLLGA
jgi:hypothetical protein